MSNYITEAGTIFWERAEPFIKMLGEHERQSFEDRIKQMNKRGRGGKGGFRNGGGGFVNDYEDFGFVDKSDDEKDWEDEEDEGPIVKRGNGGN